MSSRTTTGAVRQALAEVAKALGHLPGALNVPLRELEMRLSELPRDQEIVAYRRGPYCVLSFEAVAALRSRRFTQLPLAALQSDHAANEGIQ